MKNITFHDSFSPTGATDSVTYTNVFTFGAGVQWFEAYAAAKEHNVLIVGGFSKGGSVGVAGGWLAGGGHSALAPNYGLGVDNVLEIEIVTADGKLLIANSYQNQDLFWALRGGGGGTWGVVTSVSYKTHPSTPFSAAFLTVNSTNANSTQNLLAEIIRITPSLVDQGYGGYGGVFSNQLQLTLFSPNVTESQNQATFLPLFEFAASQPGLSVQNLTTEIPDFWTIYDLIWSNSPSQVGSPIELSSWLLPKDVVVGEDPMELAGKLLKTSGIELLLVTGGQVSRVDPDSVGLNPAWRSSLVYTIIATVWQEGANETQIDANRQQLIQDMKILEGIAPDSGAYLNEASRYEFDWKKSFFGCHYDRLLAIKRKFDPNSLFLVYEGIGSDEWDAELICRV